MLVGEFWSILGQSNLVYCQGFCHEKIQKSDPSTQLRDLWERCDVLQWALARVEYPAANDFSDIWGEKSTKSDQ